MIKTYIYIYIYIYIGLHIKHRQSNYHWLTRGGWRHTSGRDVTTVMSQRWCHSGDDVTAVLTVLVEHGRGDEELEDAAVPLEGADHLTPHQELAHLLRQLPQFLHRTDHNAVYSLTAPWFTVKYRCVSLRSRLGDRGHLAQRMEHWGIEPSTLRMSSHLAGLSYKWDWVYLTPAFKTFNNHAWIPDEHIMVTT